MHTVVTIALNLPASQYVPCRNLPTHHFFPGHARVKVRMTPSRILARFHYLLLPPLFLLTGCGGGNGTQPPPPEQITVTISPATATVTIGSTQQFTAAVTGTTNTAVTWSVSPANGGTVSATGMYTAPATVPTGGTCTVTATSQADSTKSASATVTVKDDMAQLTSIDPQSDFCLAECMPLVTVYFSGGRAGDVLNFGSFSTPLTADNVAAGQIQLVFAYDTDHYVPGRQMVFFARGDRTSNALFWSFLGDLNTVAVSSATQVSSAEVFENDQNLKKISAWDPQTGAKLREFPSAGWLVRGIAYDDGTGNLLFTVSGAVFEATTADGDGVGSTGYFDVDPLAIAAKGGYGCNSQPPDDSLTILDLSAPVNSRMSPVSMAIGNNPWNTAMVSLGGQLACIVFNAGDSQLSVVKVPETSLWNSTTLVGLTEMGNLPDIVFGGWQMAVLEPSETVKIVAALSRYDKKVVLTKITVDDAGNLTFTDMGTVVLDPKLDLNLKIVGAPFRIAADSVHGIFIVALDDNVAGLTRFASINPATGAVAQLGSTSSLLAVGFAVSPDGSKLIACQNAQSASNSAKCEFPPNQ